MPYILALELVDHEGTPAVAHEVHVCHPNPVLGDLGPCDQEAREEEQDRNISWQSSVCCVHFGGDSRNQISQHCAANVGFSMQYYFLETKSNEYTSLRQLDEILYLKHITGLPRASTTFSQLAKGMNAQTDASAGVSFYASSATEQTGKPRKPVTDSWQLPGYHF